MNSSPLHSPAIGYWAAVDGDMLLVQADLLLDRGLDNEAADPGGPAVYHALADRVSVSSESWSVLSPVATVAPVGSRA